MSFVLPNPDTCTGCRLCEVICSFNKSCNCDPFIGRIGVGKYEINSIENPVVCRQCEEPECVQVCPVGALVKDPFTGVVEYDQGKCIKCGLCTKACPWGSIWKNKRDGFILKCDLCGGDPECVKYCPTNSLFLANSK